MTSLSPLEILPLLILERIYVKIRDLEELESSLQRWNAMPKDGRNRHVRRLKISWAADVEDSRTAPRGKDEDVNEEGDPTGVWNYVSHGIGHWTRLTDFIILRCLVIPWCGNDLALAEIASRGDLRSILRLKLSSIEDESEQSQIALHLYLSSLNPLERLILIGYISPQTFRIIVLRHGENLRNLEIHPEADRDFRNPLVELNAPVMQHFAEHCPHLTYLSIPVNRTRGDSQELSIYRALSKLPRLQNLRLRLQYSIGPDEDLWDDERDGQYPLGYDTEVKDIPFEYIRQIYTNVAMDSTLALSIFNLISSSSAGSGSLGQMKVALGRKISLRTSAAYGTFHSTIRYFGPPWKCTRNERGEVKVQELEKRSTARYRED
ncbi:hypothetical protein BKA65DRAFT_485952 [Rhexocercosporidium sp. MPI-PUGE-AT-0058]|nr:hypothetical protein BKA65DRAFT_485952 [Rhexocercosporidium sp. MPI-PUGE-AT-0058]